MNETNSEIIHDIYKEIVITRHHNNEVQIALLEDKKLVEIHREKTPDECAVGDIYLGKVKKIMPGLNAAFVNIGSERDAFLHYLDLGFHAVTINNFVQQAITNRKKSIAHFPIEPEVEKIGRIGDIITPGQQLLVQIAKEPISTKGARVSMEISFAGRYLVLVPFIEKITVSTKIRSHVERKRLRKIVQAVKPKNFGVVIRTVANGADAEQIESDLLQLLEKWKALVAKLPNATAPCKVATELDKTSVLIRDIVDDSYSAIYVDTPILYEEVKNYIKSFSPEKKDIVKLYKEKQPIFEYFNIAKQIKGSFGRIVTVKNGVYLIVEHTEAMHVIDVNSGKRLKSSQSQEENALEANLMAAAEIVRQLRLRDMGGIIIIDFIDLAKSANRSMLNHTMMELMRNDKSRHTILPVNKFGLIQITRQRVREATVIDTTDTCPACMGTGKLQSVLLLEDEIENTLDFLFNKQHETDITIVTHPFVHAYLTKGFVSKRIKWMLNYMHRIKIIPNQEFQINEYKCYNKDMEEIVLWTAPNHIH
jgi:ribonuclease G